MITDYQFNEQKDWISEGNKLLQRGALDSALICYDFAIKQDSSNYRALYNKGIVFEQMKKSEEAIDMYIKSINIMPRQSVMFRRLASIMEIMGRKAEANKILDSAIKIANQQSSNVEEAFMNHKYDIAITYCDSLLDDYVWALWAYNYKGLCLFQLQKYEQALFCFGQSLMIDSLDNIVLYNISESLFMLGRYQDALRYIENSLKVKSDNIYSLKLKIMILDTLKLTKESIDANERLKEVQDRQVSSDWPLLAIIAAIGMIFLSFFLTDFLIGKWCIYVRSTTISTSRDLRKINSQTSTELEWVEISLPVINSHVSSLTIDFNDCLYIGTTSDGVFKLDIKKNFWEPLGLKNISIHSLLVDLNNRIFVETADNRIFCTHINMINWRVCNPSTGNIRQITLDINGDLLILTSFGVFCSTDGGYNWVLKDIDLMDDKTKYFLLHPDGSIILERPWGGLFCSKDNGKHWSPLGFTDIVVKALAIDAKRGIIACTNDGFYYSSYKNNMWKELKSKLFSDIVNAMVITADGVIYVSTYSSIFRSIKSIYFMNICD